MEIGKSVLDAVEAIGIRPMAAQDDYAVWYRGRKPPVSATVWDIKYCNKRWMSEFVIAKPMGRLLLTTDDIDGAARFTRDFITSMLEDVRCKPSMLAKWPVETRHDKWLRQIETFPHKPTLMRPFYAEWGDGLRVNWPEYIMVSGGAGCNSVCVGSDYTDEQWDELREMCREVMGA